MYFEARTSKLEPVNGWDKLGDKKGDQKVELSGDIFIVSLAVI